MQEEEWMVFWPILLYPDIFKVTFVCNLAKKLSPLFYYLVFRTFLKNQLSVNLMINNAFLPYAPPFNKRPYPLVEENQYVVLYFPKNMTDQFQPIDLTVNGPAKAFLKEIFETWRANQVMEKFTRSMFP